MQTKQFYDSHEKKNSSFDIKRQAKLQVDNVPKFAEATVAELKEHKNLTWVSFRAN